ncbi:MULTISPECIES: LysR family transcriptional regulator [unclassified Solwaraspora]|uniref:LysR family transcriptional regulator n=1 Tax=unclassified Solwaraspora TaxID=2627926 RepID=UPI00259B37AB|nr:LysR substrate-binding domain-containing protein [Solwaraspora sp. WMMA2056]WJK38182.1 LysR substrate-binding domain-containing protein [Solwaraspora sp. WMMA2056]
MSVDLRVMRYVVAVAEEGSFEGAARRLHMAQPPLSRQIRDLERQLGVPLFDRRPTRLTDAGAAFVASARRVLDDAESVVRVTRAAGSGQTGTVRLGVVASAAAEVLPRLLAALRVTHPQITVRTQEAWPAELDAGLRAGRFDLVLTRGLPARSDVDRCTVRREPLVAVVDAGHRLALRTDAGPDDTGPDGVGLADLAGGRLSLPPEELAPGYRSAVLAACVRAGVVVEIADCAQLGWRRVGLADENSFALVPRSLATLPTMDGVVLPLTDEVAAPDLELVWRRDATPPAGLALATVVGRLTRDQRRKRRAATTSLA